MSMRIVITILGLTISGLIQQSQAYPTPAHAEVERTVEAINGKWVGKMTAKVPKFPVEVFDWTMNCNVVARGFGASCTNGGKASIGELAETCLLAYDTDGKAVHYMCVTSSGEVHDHKGKWTDAKTIEFEPLRGGMMGQTIIETIRWHFPTLNTIVKTSEVKLSDGSSMNFEFRGQRQ